MGGPLLYRFIREVVQMPYRPIELDPPKVPESLRVFVAERVDPMLHDIHAALTFPPSGQQHPGFNLTGAMAALSVLGGLGTIFQSGVTDNCVRFKWVAKRCHPLDGGLGLPDIRNYGSTLYKNYRNTLEHNFGLSLKVENGVYVPDKLDVPSKVERALGRGLQAAELAEIEADEAWPSWLPASLMRRGNQDSRWILTVDALYAVARRVVKALAEEPSLHTGAQKTIADWWTTRQANAAKQAQATMSSTRITVSTSTADTHATTRSISDVASWAPEMPTAPKDDAGD